MVKNKHAILIILFAIILITTIFLGYSHKKNYYTILKNQDNCFTIILYNTNKNIVFSENLPKEPSVIELDKNLIQIKISLGSPLNYSYFFNPVTSNISSAYENIVLVDKNKVIFFKDNKLIISDIFNQKLFYKEIILDFAPTSVPSCSIIEARFIDDNKIEIEYLKGIEFIRQNEIINLKGLRELKAFLTICIYKLKIILSVLFYYNKN
ncbi:MAG: hypothetical protein N4A50_04155 [Vallitalea sp.]|jgi:hypothetical protein|nr:hypothetical protein [Vallitalea sp.]